MFRVTPRERLHIGSEYMAKDKKPTQYELALRELPEHLREPFDDLFEEYRFRTTVRHGKPFVSAFVLADLVRAGWRRAAEPMQAATPKEQQE